MRAVIFSRKQRFSAGFIAGLGAGIIATALMLLLSVTVGGISLPEVLGSTFTEAISSSAFDYLHRLIGGDAKHYLFYSIIVGQCLVFALSGGICNLVVGDLKSGKGVDAQGRLHWLTGLIIAGLLWLITGLGFLPLTGAGIFGAILSIGMFGTMLSLAVVGLTFGLLFVLIQNWLAVRRVAKHEADIQESPEEEMASESRRTILRNGLVLLGVGTLGVIAWRFISGGAASTSNVSVTHLVQSFKNKVAPPKPNYGTIQPVAHLSSEITPNNQFYVVSKNLFADPVVNGSTWSLSVGGTVAHPYTLNYNELMALPMKQQNESQMCISNEVGGSYMSNAAWEGVPLTDLLKRAGVQSGAVKVVLYAADDYSDSIHLDKAMDPTTLVAVRMNGATLPQGHGYPARLLVPGIYGMKHVKWITKIQVVNQDYEGYWQQRGWSDPAPVRMTSRIDAPLNGTKLAAKQTTYVAGVAFSGNKGIGQVDVSFDGGRTWNTATLKKPQSNFTWVLWELPWQPPVGSHTIAVRAIDLEGNVQNPQQAEPAPNGSSGYHTITVNVS